MQYYVGIPTSNKIVPQRVLCSSSTKLAAPPLFASSNQNVNLLRQFVDHVSEILRLHSIANDIVDADDMIGLLEHRVLEDLQF